MAEPPSSNLGTVVDPRFSVSVEYTDELLMRVYKPSYIRSATIWGWYLLVFCCLLCLVSCENLRSGLRGLLLVMITYSLVMMFCFRGSFRKANRLYPGMAHRRMDFTFDDYGVNYVFALGAARLKWNVFASVDREMDLWSFRMGEKSVYPIPVALMSSDLQEFVVRKCSENRVEVR